MVQPKVYIRTGVDPKVVSKLPKMTVDQWRKLGSAKPRLITDATKASANSSHQKSAENNLAALTSVYKSAPAALARFGVKDGKHGSANPSPAIVFLGKDQKPHTVRSMSRDAMVHDALVARAMLNSRTNKAQVYAAAFKVLLQRAEKDARLAAKIKDVPSAIDVTKSAVRDIDRGIATLIELAAQFGAWLVDSPSTPPPGFPASCGLEEGTGNGGDSRDCDASAPRNPAGLLQNRFWPLKFFTTCVRNQANRGTCPSFSTTAAMESCIAVTHNRWVNLSEQDLYKHQRHDWFPFDDYDDGFTPPVSLLFQLLSGYRFPWERDWDYNPSKNRLDDTVHHTYSHSCDLYNNANCSDTNHQSHQSCHQIDQQVQHEITHTVSTWVEDVVTVVDDVVDWFGNLLGQKTHTETWGHWVEQTVTEVVTDIVSTTVCVYDTNIAGTSGFGVTGASVFWDPLTDGQVGIALAKLSLSSRVPVIYCMWAMPSFQNAAATGGYVMYAGSNESPGKDSNGNDQKVSDLGHCICLTGFVDNADLPAGAPPGSGGGYFIAKNSWATNFGDCGFAYLPYDWVVQWGQVMCTINSITP